MDKSLNPTREMRMTLLKFEKRKESIGKLRNIVSALRSMAALRVQQTQKPVKGMRQYRKIMAHSIARFRNFEDISATTNEKKGKKMLIVFCSEYGFVGGYNRSILEEVKKLDMKDYSFGFIGTRGLTLATEFKIEPDWAVPSSGDYNSVQHKAREIAAFIYQAVNDGVNSIKLLYAEKREAKQVEIKFRPLFPVEVAKFHKSDDHEEMPLLNMPPEDLLKYLTEEYIMASLGCAVMESLQAENTVRLNAMDQAHQNITKKYDQINLLLHQKYQEEITTELLDIITGFKVQKEKIIN